MHGRELVTRQAARAHREVTVTRVTGSQHGWRGYRVLHGELQGLLQNHRFDAPSPGVLTNRRRQGGKLGMRPSADRARMTNGGIATGLGTRDDPKNNVDWSECE